jgi:hypothetical protein
VLHEENPLFADWPAALKDDPDYKIIDATGNVFLPIIPLMGLTRVAESTDPWPVCVSASASVP